MRATASLILEGFLVSYLRLAADAPAQTSRNLASGTGFTERAGNGE
jgi:hypothetical protein